MPEERFETDTILRDTTVEVTRPVEVDADGTPVRTETVTLPASERVEVVTCERYPEYCPTREGFVPLEEAVVVGVDMVDRATGTDAAVALAYCPECAASEFGYVRERDAPTVGPDGPALHETSGYLFDARDARWGDELLDGARGKGLGIAVPLAVLGVFLAAIGAGGLLLWTIFVAAAAASTMALVMAAFTVDR